jgi:iron(III) transport system substrate-binding protein
MSKSLKALFAACALVAAGAAIADSQVVNLYSARHYSTDEELYNGFTKPPASRSTAWTATTPASSRA